MGFGLSWEYCLWSSDIETLKCLNSEWATYANAFLVFKRLIVKNLFIEWKIVSQSLKSDVRYCFVFESLTHIATFFIMKDIIW